MPDTAPPSPGHQDSGSCRAAGPCASVRLHQAWRRSARPPRGACTPSRVARRRAGPSPASILLGCLVALATGAGHAGAQAPAAPLRLELNRLEAREGGACRVWFVASNPAPEAVDPLRVDLVLFGR